MNGSAVGRWRAWLVGAVVGVGVAVPAEAQMAVIDAAAIKQLVVQVNYWKQQIDAMKNELGQLQKTHSTLVGPRGMELLVPTSVAERNYLPGDWAEMASMLEGKSAKHAGLSAQIDALVEARAVLDDARLEGLDAPERERLLAARKSAASASVLAQRAYANAGQRFAALQDLVAAVGATADAKAIADLQGRIAAEEAMLGNEQAKLATLHQAAQAEQWVQATELREAAIAGHGQFSERFHPELP